MNFLFTSIAFVACDSSSKILEKTIKEETEFMHSPGLVNQIISTMNARRASFDKRNGKEVLLTQRQLNPITGSTHMVFKDKIYPKTMSIEDIKNDLDNEAPRIPGFEYKNRITFLENDMSVVDKLLIAGIVLAVCSIIVGFSYRLYRATKEDEYNKVRKIDIEDERLLQEQSLII